VKKLLVRKWETVSRSIVARKVKKMADTLLLPGAMMSTGEPSRRESRLYEIVMNKMHNLFRSKGIPVSFEITASGTLSDEMKRGLSDIQLFFIERLKRRPDVIGYNKDLGYIVIEVKDKEIDFDSIYQLKEYSDLFMTRFAFLVSSKPIPEKIRRYFSKIFIPRNVGIYWRVFLVHFDPSEGKIVEWYERSPFSFSMLPFKLWLRSKMIGVRRRLRQLFKRRR